LAGLEGRKILLVEGPARVRLLSSLRAKWRWREFHVHVVVSSGAGVESLLRMPRDLASLAYLFGLGEKQALDAVSVNPVGIVLRNREKLSSRFVAPGITVVKEGKSS
jgi:RNase P/RNase MRP subunit p30